MNNDKNKKEKRHFKWFVNDSDGLSMIDSLTVVFTIFFLISKVVHVILLINLQRTEFIFEQIGSISKTIDGAMNLILTYYFVKTAIDTTSNLIMTKMNKPVNLIEDHEVINTDEQIDLSDQTESITSDTN